MSVTIYDVAKKANIAPPWVSKTLAGHPDAEKLKPETRERIRAAARELGYHRNQLAASIRTGCVQTAALIYSGSYSHFYVGDILPGIFDRLRQSGFGLIVYMDDKPAEIFPAIIGNGIKYIISASIDPAKRKLTENFCREHNRKLVYLFERAQGEFPVVNVDNFLGAKLAVEYLAEHGHRRIALFCVPHRVAYQEQRHAGYLAAMKESGLEVIPSLVSCSDECEKEAKRMLSLSPGHRPTAAFAISDTLAERIQNTAVLMGFKLPRDFSVVGFGNIKESEHALSPLVTIEDRKRDWGTLAVDLLFGKKTKVPCNAVNEYLLKPELVIRKSVWDLHKSKPRRTI